MYSDSAMQCKYYIFILVNNYMLIVNLLVDNESSDVRFIVAVKTAFKILNQLPA